MADIPFARALGSAQRGERILSKKGVIGVTQKRDRCYACTPRTPMNATSTSGSQYPTKGIGHTVTPYSLTGGASCVKKKHAPRQPSVQKSVESCPIKQSWCKKVSKHAELSG